MAKNKAKSWAARAQKALGSNKRPMAYNNDMKKSRAASAKRQRAMYNKYGGMKANPSPTKPV